VAIVVVNLSESLSIKYATLVQLAAGANYATLYEHPDLKALAATRDPASPFRVVTIPELYRHPKLGTGWWLVPPVHPWAQGLETADGYMVLYSKRYQAFWQRVIAPLEQRLPVRFARFMNWGNQVYLFAPVGGFATPSIRMSDWCSLDLLSLANVRFLISPLPIDDENLLLRASEHREEQLVWAQRTTGARLLDLLRGNNPTRALYIYENPSALPRAFVVRRIRVFPDPKSALLVLGGVSAVVWRRRTVAA